jgi:cyclopropane fatty-acyl-phospholipid synthase-like methyltransferase
MITKFSKSYNNILNIKKDFFDNNETNLSAALKINKFIKKQKIRKQCKICKKKNKDFFIKNFEIPYALCSNCNHLNGKYEDTKEFVNWLYYSASGNNYSRNYLTNFNLRVKNIYLPKVDFLKSVVKKKFTLLDFGAGGGHFLKALEIKNIKAYGIEPSKSLVTLGNKFLKKNFLKNIELNESFKHIEKLQNIDVISLIGVLEHLQDPLQLIRSFKKSKVEYLYFSVPLFSLTTFFENNFPHVFPRVLSGGHTHLFTKESLYFITKKFNLKIMGEWWFGTDMPDLYRSLLQSRNQINKKIYGQNLDKHLFKIVDELQNIIDKKKMSSQVHMILKNN